MGKDSVVEEAPIYCGAKDERLWFFDDEHHKWKYQRLIEEFDYNVMNSLVALGIGENRCPTEAQWAEFCIINGIIVAMTDNTTVVAPKKASLKDVGECSWHQMWSFLGNYPQKTEKKFGEGFIGALMRIFIPRHHSVDGPDRPYNQSFFVTRWNNYNHYPDWFNDKVGNIRLYHLQRGKEVFETFSEETKKEIILVAKIIPPILKDVNLIIKE